MSNAGRNIDAGKIRHFLAEYFFDRRIFSAALAAAVVLTAAAGLIMPLLQRQLVNAS